MNNKLLSIVCCPSCLNDLELTALEEKGKVVDGSEALSCKDEVATGLLKCACGIVYPVIEGVPRLLKGGLSAFPGFWESYQSRAKSEMRLGDSPEQARNGKNETDYDYIRRSFSKEWELFDYTSDKTWGWTLQERKRVFLEDMALTQSELRGRLLLDAGCGNGTLTAALSTFGMEVIGIDLNDGLAVANRNRARFAGEWGKNVYFVQGNLFDAPLKRTSFDLIYCSGVIHHTPNSKETFKRLVPLVKKGGRLYVWVYGERGFLARVWLDSGRQLKKFMSLQSLLITCQKIAPFYELATRLLNAFLPLREMKFRKRTVREITLDLFDAFAPQYNHRQTPEEVQHWFTEQGFTNITVSGRQKHGFGVYGDRFL